MSVGYTKFYNHYKYTSISSLLNLVVDIDECQTSQAACNQHCVNTEGSYKCTCDAGYTLDSIDEQTCLGMLKSNNVSSAALCYILL